MIDLADVTIQSGPFSLSGVSLSIPAGAYAVLMGGTGQGKTTILEAICGLRSVTAGRIVLDQRDVTRVKTADRGLGYVPQDLALFPTMSVREHLEFALRLRRWKQTDIDERVLQLSDELGIGPLLGRGVRGLSGGESQRVALGRALSFRPRILLMDEPLNALDERTRDRLCELLRSVQRLERLTTLHITHSRVEAQLVADRLYVLEGGRVREEDISRLAGRAEPEPERVEAQR
jgi:ABC-type sugar transport system ATPase subunit